MTRIKNADLFPFETDRCKIAEHLRKVLKDVRKKKLARDLIGDDERSVEIAVDDFGLFAEELSEGMGITYLDEKRITERAQKLAECQIKAAKEMNLKD